MATRFYPLDDTYAVDDQDYTHGHLGHLGVTDDEYHKANTYLFFGLYSWVGKTLDPDNGAVLKLYIDYNHVPSNLSTYLVFKRITEPWDEDTLRWNNAPNVDNTPYKRKRLYSGDDGWGSYNITSIVQEILDQEGCCGVRVEIDDYTVWFSSKEGDHAPRLELLEALPEGLITDGSVDPEAQEAGGDVELTVDLQNVGTIGGYFELRYYEGTIHLRTGSVRWVGAGQTVSGISEIFEMPGHDFTIIVHVYNQYTMHIDYFYSITCYLIGGTEYYVKIGGNDSLSGSSWATAWATIHKAASIVPDGSTVHIGYGNYTAEPSGNKIAPQNVGALGISYSPEQAGVGGGTGTVSVEKNT